MAIAPSKLGEFVDQAWKSADELISQLRERGLVREVANDDQLRATFERARAEHRALPDDDWEYNSLEERVRVFLAPFLTTKGAQWAVPLDSLDLPDDEKGPRAASGWSWLRERG
jgi:hypothetical protein